MPLMNRLARPMRAVRMTIRDCFINSIAGSPFVPFPLRFFIYRTYGIKTETSNIRSHCWFTGKKVKIGRDAYVNYRCFFDELGSIEIGPSCRVASDVAFITSTHEIGGSLKRAGDDIGKGIKVGLGCWIGTRATILPGVTIGDGCVIGAGAVVTHDCAPNGVYVGVPARRIRDLPA